MHTTFVVATANLQYLDLALTALVAVEAGRYALNGIDAAPLRVLIVGLADKVADLDDARVGHKVMPRGVDSSKYRACDVGVNTLVVTINPHSFLRVNLAIGNHFVESAVAVGRHFDVGVILSASLLGLDSTAYALAGLKVRLESATLGLLALVVAQDATDVGRLQPILFLNVILQDVFEPAFKRERRREIEWSMSAEERHHEHALAVLRHTIIL